MHLIILNIPPQLHSCDLRNFFSGALEKETFNCFHFLHALQTDLLVDIIVNSSPDSNGNLPSCNDNRYGLRCGHDNPERNEVPRLQTSQATNSNQCEVKSDGGITQPQNDSSESSSCVQDRLIGREGDEDIGNEGDGDAGGSCASKTHWLKSIAAGLASFISEQKIKMKITKLEGKKSKKWKRKNKISEKAKGSDEQTRSGCEKSQSEVKDDGGREGYSANDHGYLSLNEVLSPHHEDTAKRTCCIVEVKNSCWKMFMRRYNRRHWVTRSGDILPQRCIILRMDFTNATQCAVNADNMGSKQLRSLTPVCSQLRSVTKLKHDKLMPQGNVGTTTRCFKEIMKNTKTRYNLAERLGIDLTREGVADDQEDNSGHEDKEDNQNKIKNNNIFTANGEVEQLVVTANGHLIPSSADFEEQQKRGMREGKTEALPKGPCLDLEEERENKTKTEECERHEPCHEDNSSQNHIKEHRFEELLEVVWKIALSSLVLYMDTPENHSNKETSAGDKSVKDDGDLDARAGVDMTDSDILTAGKPTSSASSKKKNRMKKKEKYVCSGGINRIKKKEIGPTMPPAIGKFEEHTKGFGRRMLEAQGWKEGQGLGIECAGMPYALEVDGQRPQERKGLGYRGKKKAPPPLDSRLPTAATTSPQSFNAQRTETDHHIQFVKLRQSWMQESAETEQHEPQCGSFPVYHN